MKSRIILFILAAGVVTLSFTFAGVKSLSNSQSQEIQAVVETHSEPIGGFVSADPIE